MEYSSRVYREWLYNSAPATTGYLFIKKLFFFISFFRNHRLALFKYGVWGKNGWENFPN